MKGQSFVVKAAENLMNLYGLLANEECPEIEVNDNILMKGAMSALAPNTLERPNHKYIKRTGTPGNYTYWYKDPSGRLVAGDAPDKGNKKIGINLEQIKQRYNLTDEDIKYRRQLGIPLNVSNVVIHSGHPKLIAEWTDSKGRNQKLYKPEYIEQASKAKFKRIFALKGNMGDIRNSVDKDMDKDGMPKEKVVATVVKLIDSCYFRVGNEKYAEENGTYGVSTLLKDHMSVGEDGISFDYVGKKSVDQHKFIADPKTTEILLKLRETPGDRLFQYQDKDGEYKPITSRDVNNYLSKWDATAKDFRTYHASRLCATYLADMGIPADEKTMKRNMVKAIQQTAEQLGHTPTVCRKNYISGEILKAYKRGEIMEDYIEKSNKNSQFSKNEQAFNALLDRIQADMEQEKKQQTTKDVPNRPSK